MADANLKHCYTYSFINLYYTGVHGNRAARCTENIGASRFALYGSGFDSGFPDFGSVRTLHCAFKTTMVEEENNLSFEASDSK